MSNSAEESASRAALPATLCALVLSLCNCMPPNPPSDAAPEITVCPAPAPIMSDANCEAAMPDLRGSIQATDDQTTADKLVVTQAPTPGTVVAAGTRLVSFTVTDSAGNTDTCTVELVVTSGADLVVEREPADETITAGIDCMVSVPDYRSQFVVRDRCGASLIATQTPAAGTKIGLGDNIVMVSVTNQSDTVATSLVLTVVDQDQPRIRACLPEPFPLPANGICAAVLPDLTDMVIVDDCGGAVTVTQDPPPGTTLMGPQGTNVVFTATDPAGNAATCQVRVVPTDNEPPVIMTCPADRTLGATNGSARLPSMIDEVVATDNSGGRTIGQSPLPGTNLSVGTHEVTMRVIDGCGNETTCKVTVTVVEGGGGPDGFAVATILHRGYERLVAGPNVDPAVGLQTPAGYGIGAFGNRSVALSGDGTRIWFLLYDEFPNVQGDPQTQLWCVNTDGTGGMRSMLPMEDIRDGMHLLTGLTGSAVIADNPRDGKVFRATPGAAAQHIFSAAPGSCIRGTMAVSEDLSRAIYFSGCDTRLYQVNLATSPATPTVLAQNTAFAFMGVNPTSTSSTGGAVDGVVDGSSDLSRWIVATRVFLASENRFRTPVFVGTGLSSPTIQMQNVPNDFDGVADLNMTDDGGTIGYRVGPTGLSTPNPIHVQDVGSSTRTTVQDEVQTIGGLVLSDDGNRGYVRTNISFGGGDSFLVDFGTGIRRSPGSSRFADAGVRFNGARLSDDGRMMAAPVSRGVYLLCDGMDPPANFPTIDRILYRYNDADCTLIVRVEITAPRGVERIYTLPLFEGLEPTRRLAEADNPFFGERSGGGGNLSTVFAETAEDGVWERTISLQSSNNCKSALLNEDFQLRIVLVDATGSLTVFQDFYPAP